MMMMMNMYGIIQKSLVLLMMVAVALLYGGGSGASAFSLLSPAGKNFQKKTALSTSSTRTRPLFFSWKYNGGPPPAGPGLNADDPNPGLDSIRHGNIGDPRQRGGFDPRQGGGGDPLRIFDNNPSNDGYFNSYDETYGRYGPYGYDNYDDGNGPYLYSDEHERTSYDYYDSGDSDIAPPASPQAGQQQAAGAQTSQPPPQAQPQDDSNYMVPNSYFGKGANRDNNNAYASSRDPVYMEDTQYKNNYDYDDGLDYLYMTSRNSFPNKNRRDRYAVLDPYYSSDDDDKSRREVPPPQMQNPRNNAYNNDRTPFYMEDQQYKNNYDYDDGLDYLYETSRSSFPNKNRRDRYAVLDPYHSDTGAKRSSGANLFDRMDTEQTRTKHREFKPYDFDHSSPGPVQPPPMMMGQGPLPPQMPPPPPQQQAPPMQQATQTESAAPKEEDRRNTSSNQFPYNPPTSSPEATVTISKPKEVSTSSSSSSGENDPNPKFPTTVTITPAADNRDDESSNSNIIDNRGRYSSEDQFGKITDDRGKMPEPADMPPPQGGVVAAEADGSHNRSF